MINQRPDRFEAHSDKLGLPDLIVLDRVIDAMTDADFATAIFEQAEADRRDETSEYGGALIWDEEGDLVYRAFAPLIRRHDEAYISSTPCMQATYLGLAHVHFHVQRYDNAAWAGPGKGDLDFANSQHVNAIVLTYLDANTLNVDVYFPGGAIIDLGCVTR